MTNRVRHVVENRWLWVGCGGLLAGGMWRAAALQLSGGLVDLVVFVPPGTVLGVAAVWSAHAFVPERFSWNRGLVGALIGGVVASPLIAFLVTFAAAWDRPSFPLVYIIGALLAIGGGLAAGSVGWLTRWVSRWRLHR